MSCQSIADDVDTQMPTTDNRRLTAGHSQLSTHDSVLASVLIIGSGPIIIGQAAEFDYSGTQACLACREAGVRSILINSNPATIQTDPHIADVVYIEPLTVDSITQILERERPDGLIATVGGQTALNLAVALDENGVLEHYGVRILGTGLEAIRRGEDRALFADTLRAAGQPILPSESVSSVEEGLRAADRIGYPVMCRSAFALGGSGSGIAAGPDELVRQVSLGLQCSGSGQVLIEASVYGWAEIEYEVIRDHADNGLVVCNMENVDPMGVHTGDSIVVAPSQTLSDEEYHVLRAAAIQVVRALGVEGACNVQFALNRESGYGASTRATTRHSPFYVIEVNPRLSRSSALASKATGYPIAKVATRIALGYALPEIRNDITGTSAFFEPALDYVTVKIPRWPFDKFADIKPVIGTSMRSTGEVMAIGRTFEEAMRKAMRSLDRPGPFRPGGWPADLEEQLAEPSGDRLAAILLALRDRWDCEDVARLSGIHPWFVDRLAALATSIDTNGSGKHVFKMVDTCSAEFEARTPYFYSSSVPDGENEASPLPGPKAIILGSGPIRIGQGIEFDYATVHACHALSQSGVRSIIVNNNPETVSTDYSTSDRLYFEPLDLDAVAAVVENEADGLLGVIPQFGGQTAINLVQPLYERGIPILGTTPEAIDVAEDRSKTSALLADCGIPAPNWRAVDRWDELPMAVEAVGFPALIRPSYVLSGRGMIIVRTAADLERYIASHLTSPLSKPLLVDHFLEGAVELDVDAVSDGRDAVMVVMEQLEECGVHSGDSAEVYPVQTITPDIVNTVEMYTRRLAQALGIVGLMNVQYAVLGETVYVLEVNPRASRSVPFASKASGIPLADLAIRVILGQRLSQLNVASPGVDHVCIKEVVLPFRTFTGLVPILGPEMQSTGESMGRGRSFGEAYWKARLGADLKELPFGRPVYVSAPTEVVRSSSLAERLAAAGCSLLVAPDMKLQPYALECTANEVLVPDLGMAIVLGRSPDEVGLLRRCVSSGVPYVSTAGGLRALLTALDECVPRLQVEAHR